MSTAKWLILIAVVLLGGYLGSQLGNSQTEAYLWANYPWQGSALPKEVKFKGFYLSDKPQVFLETVDGKLFRQYQGQWVETTPEEIQNLEIPDHPRGSCSRGSLSTGLPIPTLSAEIVDQMSCQFLFSPETLGYRQFALLADNSLYTWSLDVGPVGLGRGMITGFYQCVFGGGGLLLGVLVSIILKRYLRFGIQKTE